MLLLLAVGGAMAYKWERKKKQKAYLARLAEWKRQKTMPQPFKYKFITPDSLENRYLLLSPYKLYMWQHGRYMILDTKGNIYAEKYVPGLVNGFRQIKIGNTPYYTYMVNDTTVHHILKAGLVAGYAVLLDSALREVKKYRLLPHNDIVIDSNQGLDLHDFIIFI